MSLTANDERSIATTIAAILIAVATFSLTIMALEKNAPSSVSNEIFGFLGLGALLSSALIIDSILDKANCSPMYRFKDLMNGGYFLFCLVMAGMSFGILFLYNHQELSIPHPGWQNIYWFYIISSTFLFLKLMLDDRDHLFGPLLGGSYVMSIIVTNCQQT